MSRCASLVVALLLAPSTLAGEKSDGYVPLFNGKDLTGWVNVNGAPGTFFVKDEMVITTGRPTGYLRTDRQYENFILEFDWMHLPPKPGAVGNSGLFVWADPIPAVGSGYTRGIEVQVLVNLEYDWATSHGDIFSIWGAKCKPDRPHPRGYERCLPAERRAKGENEWNHYKVLAKDGVIKLEVNGKEVSGVSECNPRKGYLALESEGSECRFKNIKIKELPSSKPRPDEAADPYEGHQNLFNGLDFAGWKASEEHLKHWRARDGVIAYDGQLKAKDPHLWTEKEFGDFELVLDWRLAGKPKKMARPVILSNGDVAKDKAGKEKTQEVLDGGDSGVFLRGSQKAQLNIWSWPVGSGEVWGYRTDKDVPAEVRAAVTPKTNADKPAGQWNRFVVRMKGDRLTVKTNGKVVIDNAQLPGVPSRGPIGLQHHGDPVEFRNVFVRELKD